MRAVDILIKSLVSRSSELELPVLVGDAAPVFSRRQFRVAAAAKQLGVDDVGHLRRLAIPETEPIGCGVIIDHYAVLVSDLGESDSDADARYRAAEFQAAVVLSWLTDRQREDLHLFLVGPVGSCDDTYWSDLASRIERDERICRKLVWLPPADDVDNSVGAFLGRTFLARPWRALRTSKQPRLDPISSVADVLADDSGLRELPKAVVRKWIEILLRPNESADLVGELIDALDSRESDA